MQVDGSETGLVAADDRGLAYGDGLFETLRVRQGRLLFLEGHMQRLVRGCEVLGLEADPDTLRAELQALALQAPRDAIVKLILTRGSGGRGYRPPQQQHCRRLLSLHALPDYSAMRPEAGIRAFVCTQRLAHQPVLAGLKHLNRLEQVLASREFPDASFMEGLMLDYSDSVVEGTRSNVCVVQNGKLLTPELGQCGIDGVMRQALARHFGARFEVATIPLTSLDSASELFFCSSVVGVWPVTLLRAPDADLRFAPGPFADEAAGVFARELQG